MEQENYILTENPESVGKDDIKQYKGHIYRILSYSIPLSVSMACKPLMNLVDFIRANPDTIQSIQTIHGCYILTSFIPQTLGAIILYGLVTLCSRSYSCGDFEKFFDVYKAGLQVSTLFGLLYTIISLPLVKVLLQLINIDAEQMDIASKYCYMSIGLGTIVSMWSICINAVLLSTKHQYVAFMGMILEFLTVILCTLLPVKVYDADAIICRAIAQPAGALVNLIFCCSFVYKSHSVGSCLLPNVRTFFTRANNYKDIFKYGAVGVATNLSPLITSSTSRYLIAFKTDNEASIIHSISTAFGIIYLLEAIPQSICKGFCLAALARASHEFYHNRKLLLRKLIKFAYVCTTFIMVAAALLLSSLNNYIADILFDPTVPDLELTTDVIKHSLIITLPMQSITGGTILAPIILQVLDKPMIAFVLSLIPSIALLGPITYGLLTISELPFIIIWAYPISDIFSTICVHFIMLVKVPKHALCPTKAVEK